MEKQTILDYFRGDFSPFCSDYFNLIRLNFLSQNLNPPNKFTESKASKVFTLRGFSISKKCEPPNKIKKSNYINIVKGVN